MNVEAEQRTGPALQEVGKRAPSLRPQPVRCPVGLQRVIALEPEQWVEMGGAGRVAVGDRHPKVRRGVLLGAGAKVLGNIEIGACAKIAAGSVVLDPVPAGCTAAGVPARIIGCVDVPEPALDMDHRI